MDAEINESIGARTIESQLTTDRGRVISATRDLRPGDLIMRSASFITTVSEDFVKVMCATCFKLHPKALPVVCMCSEVGWCSEACRMSSLNQHSDSECQVLRLLHATEGDFTVDELSEIRMIVRAITLGAQQRRGVNMPAVSAEGGPIQCSNYKQFLWLCSNSDLWPDEHKVSKMFHNNPDELNGLSVEDIIHLFGRERCNCFGIWGKDHCYATSVFPLSSFVNHSCYPNATHVLESPRVLSFRALRPIAKGEEILIAYTNPNQSTADRQEQLQEEYYFTCSCVRCKGDGNTEYDKAMQAFYCKVPPCTGLLVPINPGAIVRICRSCGVTSPPEQTA